MYINSLAIVILDLIFSNRNFIPDFVLSKLYTNALLSTLNARASLSASSLQTGTGSRSRQDAGEDLLGLDNSLYETRPTITFLHAESLASTARASNTVSGTILSPRDSWL